MICRTLFVFSFLFLSAASATDYLAELASLRAEGPPEKTARGVWLHQGITSSGDAATAKMEYDRYCQERRKHAIDVMKQTAGHHTEETEALLLARDNPEEIAAVVPFLTHQLWSGTMKHWTRPQVLAAMSGVLSDAGSAAPRKNGYLLRDFLTPTYCQPPDALPFLIYAVSLPVDVDEMLVTILRHQQTPGQRIPASLVAALALSPRHELRKFYVEIVDSANTLIAYNLEELAMIAGEGLKAVGNGALEAAQRMAFYVLTKSPAAHHTLAMAALGHERAEAYLRPLISPLTWSRAENTLVCAGKLSGGLGDTSSFGSDYVP